VSFVSTYLIVHRKIDLDFNDFFSRPHRDIRGHNFKLYVTCVKRDVGKYSFAHRVVQVFNQLPADVVNATSQHTFFKKRQELDLKKFLKGTDTGC